MAAKSNRPDQWQETFFVSDLVTDPAHLAFVEAYWDKYYNMQYPTNLAANRIMQLVLEQIERENYIVQTAYTLHTEDIARHDDEPSLQETGREALRFLSNVFLHEEWPAEQIYTPRALLDTMNRKNCYQRGHTVKLTFNPALSNFLVNLARVRSRLKLPV